MNKTYCESDCAALYKAYPRRVGRIAAYKAIARALKLKSCEELMTAVQAFARQVVYEEREERFIPHPATWFNAGRYEDEPFVYPARPLTEYQKWNPPEVK